MGEMDRKLVLFAGTAAELIKLQPIIAIAKKEKILIELIFSGQAPKSFFAQAREFEIENVKELYNRGYDLKSGTHALFWFVFTLFCSLFRKGTLSLFSSNIVLVHGDTLSTLLGAIMARRYGAYQLVHVEAGRRSGSLWRPFPEEICRRFVSRLAHVHLCENQVCADHLSAEGNSGKVIVLFGNTQQITIQNRKETKSEFSRPYSVLNLHRFENLSLHWPDILKIAQLSARNRTAYFICHGHVAEKMSSAERKILESQGVRLIGRMEFFSFMDLLAGAEFLVTDGSGNQDDIALLGTPTLITRNELETNTGLAPLGSAVLAGWDWQKIESFFEEYSKYRRAPIQADARIQAGLLAFLNWSKQMKDSV